MHALQNGNDRIGFISDRGLEIGESFEPVAQGQWSFSMPEKLL